MSAQGEKNQLIKPGESPPVLEKSEAENSEEKDTGKDDDKAGKHRHFRSASNWILLQTFILFCFDGSDLLTSTQRWRRRKRRSMILTSPEPALSRTGPALTSSVSASSSPSSSSGLSSLPGPSAMATPPS